MNERNLILYNGRRYGIFAYTKLRVSETRYHGILWRRNLIDGLDDHQAKAVDEYRAWFSAAGYLEKANGTGSYTKLKNVPDNLTSTQLRREAYGMGS